MQRCDELGLGLHAIYDAIKARFSQMPGQEFGIRYAVFHDNQVQLGLHRKSIGNCPRILRLPDRKCELEASAGIGGTLSPDAAAVAADDAVHNRQSNAGTREFVTRVQSLKDPK
jgi:hypothetical protein